jgi:hypothetical protein
MQQKGSSNEAEARKKPLVSDNTTHSLTLTLKRLVIQQKPFIFEVLFCVSLRFYRRLRRRYVYKAAWMSNTNKCLRSISKYRFVYFMLSTIVIDNIEYSRIRSCLLLYIIHINIVVVFVKF